MRELRNPVYDGDFADPFVWRHDGVYYAVGTGLTETNVFPLLRSADFATWEPCGGALKRPDPALGDTFWAPEVAFRDGTFYLYYSVGFDDKGHQLRVATSRNPAGPYEDAGVTLVGKASTPFAIDAHVFEDDDGSWYLYFARDFLDAVGGVRAGTALSVARLRTMLEVEPGTERVVARARYDWQRFQSERPMYGATYDWHTLEGPFVRKKDGLYYCFYSGGRWEDETYGVDYVVAAHPLGPYEQASTAEGPRVLRTRPGEVLGPGHNSITTGPDGETDWVVYHAWDPATTARRMFLDRLDWTPEGPRCRGPTLSAQTLP